MSLNYQVCAKEKFYFFLQVVISLILYTAYFVERSMSLGVIFAIMSMFGFVFHLLLMAWLATIIMGGLVKGNAVKASPSQFKALFEIVEEQSKALGLRKVPKVYVTQRGGFINAFATKFLRKYYVVLLAPVVAEAYKDGEDTLRFIVGHELGHIKRNHLSFWKMILMLPVKVIFPLSRAYSRACEYTCDRIGYALSPKGAIKGMGLLAVGPELYRRLDEKSWMEDSEEELGFATWLTEIFSSHPHLIKRVKALHALNGGKGFARIKGGDV